MKKGDEVYTANEQDEVVKDTIVAINYVSEAEKAHGLEDMHTFANGFSTSKVFKTKAGADSDLQKRIEKRPKVG